MLNKPKAPKHRRIKPKAKAPPTAKERAHMDRVARIGCLVCGQPASLHHIMHMQGKIRRRDHRYVVPLCREHHQGKTGIHGLGSEKAFNETYGIDLPEIARGLWDERNI